MRPMVPLDGGEGVLVKYTDSVGRSFLLVIICVQAHISSLLGVRKSDALVRYINALFATLFRASIKPMRLGFIDASPSGARSHYVKQ